MEIGSVSTMDYGSGYCTAASDSRSLIYLPEDILVMILKTLEFKDLHSSGETCKTLGSLGIRPLFCDHRVNLDEK
jgi:hypothetical protein